LGPIQSPTVRLVSAGGLGVGAIGCDDGMGAVGSTRWARNGSERAGRPGGGGGGMNFGTSPGGSSACPRVGPVLVRKTDEGPPKRALITAMRTSERGGRTRRRGAGVVFLGLELEIGADSHRDRTEACEVQPDAALDVD